MTKDEQIALVQNYADVILDHAIEELTENGAITAAFHIMSEHENGVYLVPGNDINKGRVKDQLATLLRDRIKEQNAFAFLMVTDMFISRSMDVKAAAEFERLRRLYGLTVQGAGELGLLDVKECYRPARRDAPRQGVGNFANV